MVTTMIRELGLVALIILISFGSLFGSIVYHNHKTYECVKLVLEKNLPASDAKTICEVI